MKLSPLVLLGLVADASAQADDDVELAAVVEAHRELASGPFAEVLGPLLVPAGQVDALREASRADDDLRVALTADDGLLGLAEARHAVQDDPWIGLEHVQIALPDGFDPAEAARALLAELSFTVPTYVGMPRTGFDTALDVLAEDGVERAAYRVGGADAPVPADGELGAFLHAAVARSVPFVLLAGEGSLVRVTGRGERHGLLNVAAATAAALHGSSTTEVSDLLGVTDVDALVDAIDVVPASRLRELLHGYACTDPADLLTALAEERLAEPVED